MGERNQTEKRRRRRTEWGGSETPLIPSSPSISASFFLRASFLFSLMMNDRFNNVSNVDVVHWQRDSDSGCGFWKHGTRFQKGIYNVNFRLRLV
ncbi:hypothetical protein LINGRAPRIM_LOCUS282 [Linum grandiflorum]